MTRSGENLLAISRTTAPNSSDLCFWDFKTLEFDVAITDQILPGVCFRGKSSQAGNC